MGRTLWMRALVAAAATAVSLLVAESGARAIGFMPTFERQQLLVELDERPLYRVLPGTRDDLNSQGYRDVEWTPDKRGRQRVLFVGDSFLMGLGVRPEQTLPRRLDDLLGPATEVYNMGVLGYGPDQALVRLLDGGFDHDPDLVLLGVFPANDFADLSENELYVVRPDGDIERHPNNPVARLLAGPRLLWLARRAVTGEFFEAGVQAELVERLFGDGYELIEEPESEGSRNEIALMRGVLAEFKRATGERGVELGVIIIPSYENVQNDANFRRRDVRPEDYFANERIAVELCEALDIRYVNLAIAFTRHRHEGLYSDKDRHLSARGHALAARAIVEALAPDRALPNGR